jgi:multiple antibiotic resistance protein
VEHDLRGLIQYGALVFWSLFCVVNPVGGAATFLATTRDHAPDERARAANRAVLVAAGVFGAAIAVGNIFIFRVGIYTAGFRVSCGILLLSTVVGEWLRGGDAFATRALPVEEGADARRAGVTPLGFPLIASVGAVATAILYSGEHGEHWRRAVTAVCAAAVLMATWIAFRIAGRLTAWLGENGVRFVSGIFKLTVAGWSVDFIATGIRDFLPLILHTTPAR